MAEAKRQDEWDRCGWLLHTLRNGLTPKKNGEPWTFGECNPLHTEKEVVVRVTTTELNKRLGVKGKRRCLDG